MIFGKPSRWLPVFLLALMLWGLATPTLAATPASISAPEQVSTFVPAPLVAGIFEGVVGNRSRMIQFACIGFAIGVLILVTATRKY